MSEVTVERGVWPSDEIPPSWCWVCFDDLFDNVTHSERKLKQKDYLEKGRFPVVDQGMQLIGGYSENEDLVHPHDPPFIIFGDHTKCMKWVPFGFVQGADGTKVLKVRFAEPRFFHFALQLLRLPDKGYSRHFQFLRNSFFPLAPLKEQERIVAKLDELLSDLDAGVSALERARAKLKRYRAAILKAAVTGELTAEWRVAHTDVEPASSLLRRLLVERRRRWESGESSSAHRAKYREPCHPHTSSMFPLPSTWCWSTAEQLSDETRPITYGVIKLGVDTGDGVPVLRCSNVRHLRLDVQTVKKVDQSIAAEYHRTFLRGGEVLVNVRGTLGGVVCVPLAYAGYNIAREVAMIAPVETSVGPAIALFIGAGPLQAWLTRNTRGIAYTGINIEALKALPIPLPPLAEQVVLVAEVEERLSDIDATENYIEASLYRATRLRQSILKEAFAGRLVPQDPKDEPASVLLERIRAAAPSTNGAAKKGKGNAR